MKSRSFFQLVAYLLLTKLSFGQTLPASGFEPFEELLRREQLAGNAEIDLSFASRPIDSRYLDSLNLPFDNSLRLNGSSAPGHLQISLLPLLNRFSYNSFTPYSRNDGTMLPAVGAQNIISAGVFLKYRGFSMQLRPEWQYAANKNYQGYPDIQYDINWVRRYVWWNKIDQPEVIGPAKYKSLLPGQSNVQYSFGKLAVAVSTENLWWGPSKRNALIMSNNARGFAHLTLRTSSPVKTKIGGLEGQLIAGNLINSGGTPPEPERKYLSNQLYYPKKNKWRYLSGINFVWQPIWVKGLFVGFSKTKQLYYSDLKQLVDYVPFFVPKDDPIASVQIGRSPSQQQSSGYVRWVFNKEHAEVYAEFGSHGKRKTLRQWLEQPEKNRGVTVGLSKMFLKEKDVYWQVDVELTQLEQTQKAGIFQAQSWYLGDYVRQGYTQRGELLGATIGPGSNSQYLQIARGRSLNRVALFMERLVNNNDYYIFDYSDYGDFRRHWVDYTIGLDASWRLSSFVLAGQVVYTRSLNYQWQLVNTPGGPWFIAGRDVNNLHASISCTYLFKHQKN
ncbi:capsule assembly Wzi family protein [uncultured Imperialibacter sp.]|uniref:capsule assembly Wzi family protein n=1 Tax=uncultured Imperialibacter sp. TaxID=1672639 RepID=UPI0030D83C60|tara:strand:+ start:99273 stop:100949 length:1677 start_codon:yes stop_codon:yes gene_type:complete